MLQEKISFPLGIKQYIGNLLSHALNDLLQNASVTVMPHRKLECVYQADFLFALAKKMKITTENLYLNFILPEIQYLEAKGLSFQHSSGFLEILVHAKFAITHFQNLQLSGERKIKHENIIIDYSSPNVAKEMHVGHLRSTIIGDSLSRILAFIGHTVYPQNHLGDCGMQFGFLIAYLLQERSSFIELIDDLVNESKLVYSDEKIISMIKILNNTYRDAKDLFSRDSEFAFRANACLKKLQQNIPSTEVILLNRLHDITRQYLRYTYRVMDVQLRDSDIRGESFCLPYIADALEKMNKNNLLTLSDGANIYHSEIYKDKNGNPAVEVIKKSDSNVLYSTIDIAALYWRIYQFCDSSTTGANRIQIDRILYVTDARQTFHFQMLFEIAQRCNWVNLDHSGDKGKTALHHITFGAILNSDRKPFKTRSGDTISLLDFVNDAFEASLQRSAQSKHAKQDNDGTVRSKHAFDIAVGCIKYQDLKNDMTKDYIFNREAIYEFEGNTAAYIQNVYARISSTLSKFSVLHHDKAKSFMDFEELLDAESLDLELLDSGQLRDTQSHRHWAQVSYWKDYLFSINTLYKKILTEDELTELGEVLDKNDTSLLFKIWEFCDVIYDISVTFKPHILCGYLFDLASCFHRFYEKCSILNAKTELLMEFRIQVICLVKIVTYLGLYMLGIKTVRQM